ncbi:MAG: hypothetical protein E5Y58_15420 [Mesorhizobium sp.]|nr:MAG: hypothetical protein E5Y58_15420 [Mesorhizobium sp.]
MPSAASPFGANRLRPQRPVVPWDGLRDALTFGPKSPHELSSPRAAGHWNEGRPPRPQVAWDLGRSPSSYGEVRMSG